MGIYTPKTNKIDLENNYACSNSRKGMKRKCLLIVYISVKTCDSNRFFSHYFSFVYLLDAYIYILVVKRLISQSGQSSFTIAMTISDNKQKDIKLDIVKTTFIEEEISIKPIEHEASDDPDDKKLLRKIDLHIIPTMTLLYLLSYLDRVNIGQAKIDGLLESLKLTSAQYNACLSVFFVTYVIFEIPSNLIIKRLRPSRWIPMIMVTWGIIMTLMGLANSYGSLLACRLLLGAAESGLFPGK